MENNQKWKETSFKRKLFGGEIEIIVYDADPALLEGIIDEMYEYALKLQKIFNFYDEKSELSILNRKRKLKVSKELFEVLTSALALSEITNGKYDVTLGKEILQRKSGLEVKKVKSSYKNVIFESNNVILSHPDALIDLGSIAKGYITDKMAEFLREKGLSEFMIDSRGDILVSGDYEHIIEIQHPRKKEKNIGKIKINNKAVATSGDYNQFYEGYEKSHIINANAISVTVVAESLDEADAYASAFFVANDLERNKLANENKDVMAMVVDKDLKPKMYNGFEEILNE